MSDKVISSTTQEFLDVYDIVNDMVLLKDGSAAIVLQVGTMNFSLLAEQEQDAVIFTYGSVLNSLNYPIQINIQSQTKDATKYLRLLDEQISKATSERKAALIKQYRGFVEGLIKERNVLQKRFYIVTAANPTEMGLLTPTNLLPGQSTFNIESVEKSILLEKATNILEPRRDHLTSQFNRLGLFSRQLSTQEIIQNFYINYNPEAVEGQEISSSENYTTPLVRASFGGKFMQLNNIMQNQAAAGGQVQGQTQDQAATPPTQPLTQAPPVEQPLELSQEQQIIPEASAVPEPAVEPAVTPTPEPTPTTNTNPTPEEVLTSPAPAVEGSNETQAQIFPPAETPALETSATQDPALSPTPTLDLQLDPSLLGEAAAPTQVSGGINDLMSNHVVSSEVPQPEDIPVVETAPIVEESLKPAQEVEVMQEPDASLAPAAAPVESGEITPTPTPAVEPEPTLTEAPDFSEEISPLQIQDDAKNV